MKTVNFELSNPINYSNGSGTEIEGSFVELSSPTGKIAHLVGVLKAEIGCATKNSFTGIDLSTLGDDSKKEEDESTAFEKGDGIFSLMTMGQADMKRVTLTFKAILQNSAKIGGEKTMTLPMIDRMDYDDFENCMKTYIGNFMSASE